MNLSNTPEFQEAVMGCLQYARLEELDDEEVDGGVGNTEFGRDFQSAILQPTVINKAITMKPHETTKSIRK